MVRCGAHLSNLALGGSSMTLRLFGTKVVQEAFESEVVSALQRATNTENGGRQTLMSTSVAWSLHCRECQMRGRRATDVPYVYTSDRRSES
jgi:hypothetical protein